MRIEPQNEGGVTRLSVMDARIDARVASELKGRVSKVIDRGGRFVHSGSSADSEPLNRKQPMPSTITVRVPATLEGARDAATTVRGFLDQLALTDLEAARFELALVESASNVVKHAGCGQRGSMDISLTADEGTLQLVVRDDGKSIDTDGLNNFMSRPEEPSELAECGRGILLIRRIMDRVIYSREENRNVLTMTALMSRGKLPSITHAGFKHPSAAEPALH